jgi:uncharacterized NAD(P)/FAD-binding protein YdhS
MRLGPGRRPVVAVVGAGFSGLLTAIHLLRGDPDVEVRLLERAPTFGRGRPYRTGNPQHLLNVRASNMSAFHDRPDDFVRWLGAEGGPDAFVSRGRYGDYLHHLFRHELAASGRAVPQQGEAVAAAVDGGRWRVSLACGRTLQADAVVLGLGLPPAGAPPGADAAILADAAYVADPWSCDLAALPAGEVLLIGAGLTMVDVALSLAGGDRRLVALSRRGLLPLGHAPATAASPPGAAMDTPMAALRALRAHARAVGWREAVDSIRPQTAALWRSWPLAERRRFLRHLRPWWDIHRHRMAPVVAERIAGLRTAGRLCVEAGRLERLRRGPDGLEATIRGRGQASAHARTFAAVVNCASPQGDPRAQPGGLVADLLRQGLLRPDPLALGLDVDDALRVLASDGRPAPGLFAVGPLTRGAAWEAVAAPDLRTQTAAAARDVIAYLRQGVLAQAD